MEARNRERTAQRYAPRDAAGKAHRNAQRRSARARGYDGDWDNLRISHLRDNPLCARCLAWGLVVAARLVHHRVPITYAPHLRLERDNFVSLCLICHDTIEGRRFATKRTGMRREYTVVCGPPGSGKTTWVRERARPGDLVWDQDAFVALVGGFGDGRTPAPHLIPAAIAARQGIIQHLMGASEVERAFLVLGGARRQERDSIATAIGAKIVVLDVPAEECLQRIAGDSSRALVGWPEWEQAVTRWWDEYRATL